VTAGSWARPDDLGRGIEHLGLLDYRDTGALYRTCDAGIALTLSAHPSYLPLELMACGVPVVAFDNPAGNWVLHHERNSLRCPRTVDGLADAVERIARDGALRARLGEEALATIATGHSDWGKALSGIHAYLSDPVGQGA
jgi:O-antigen biosynthesis protein